VREVSPIRYARSGNVNVAYRVSGEGQSIDMVAAPGTVSHLDMSGQNPRLQQQTQRFTRFCRLIQFDKRGTGMSDRVTNAATLEERADDIRAVMDAAGSRQATILGASEGGAMACVYAATHPERVRSLIVWGCQARMVRSSDYPWGMDPELFERRLATLAEEWPSEEYVRGWGAGLGDAPQEIVDATLARMQLGASPAAVVALERMNGTLDIRDVLPAIRVPTLVMAREGDPIIEPDAMRDMAARIPNARLVLFPGGTHYMSAPWAGIDGEPVWSTIEEFVTGTKGAPVSDRVLTTILALDIVSSTEATIRSGDRAWRELLDAHYDAVRRTLAEWKGTLIDTAGDGLLATFDGPASAVRFGFAMLREDHELGIQIRIGVHCGEVERADDAIRGISVTMTARILAAAQPGQVLVSTTIRDLTAGSGLRFEERGMHDLKGIPDRRQLLRAVE
jgi:pimeloyl-ACP methyl ester carboxylesterase